MKRKILIYISAGFLFMTSCSKSFLDVDPESIINPEQLSSTPAAQLGNLRGILTGLRSMDMTGYAGHEDYGHKSILSGLDLMGNDVVMLYANWHMFTYNYTARLTTNPRAHMYWFTYYLQLKSANTIINSIGDTPANAELKAIRGQALALRGYMHFMLARIFGPTYVGHENELSIPLNTGVASEARNTVKEVYAQVIEDLDLAISSLDGYNRGTSRELLDKSVAQAFLAQVYLEVGRYEDAAQVAHDARQGYTLLSESEWKNGFFDISQKETMWGADINAELTTFVASFFSHFDNTNTGYAEGGNTAIDTRLYEAISDSDYRKSVFIGPEGGEFEGTTYDPYVSLKFRDLTSDRTQGDYIYLRSAELYYIEAEALARSNDEAAAQQVLFDITSQRDNAYVKSSKTGAELIEEIILQKRIEMWGEGSAWFDIKRLNQAVVRIYPGSNHPSFGQLDVPAGDNRFLFMIPQAEVNANSKILPNNPQ